ncbi:hypothetical protein KC332_g6061 [Hortaea werneckii]|uniref:Uncharacterized protein n=1 Tax=Hortaea werneckii TaxID=91943 RepID=A0A3M7IGT3_HORWE|nr:hypothetical protein KC358_g5858 [Hortaea werneckii]KAI6841956.1 hypothetical protein KC350_g5153 [Hortaea werneckii]KAI6918042.1 hypothetical protein KC348_g11045 [Hortaea werneckii]KAI6937260.1 hypothetical protein KC341_g5699 [Hortaea werneckii]KAI6972653.1 hypothetical protein KC321_g6114 [Hortaea werneckii]
MFGERKVRSTAFWTTATLALAAQVAVSAIAIRLTVTSLFSEDVYGTAIAASVLDVCVIALLLLTIALRRLPQNRKRTLVAVGLAASQATVAAVLSIYVLIWSFVEEHDDEVRNLAAGGVAAWSISVLSQSALYIYMLLPSHQHASASAQEFDAAAQGPSPVRSMKRSLSIHLGSLTPTPPKMKWPMNEPYSPADSGYAVSPTPSLRHSISQAVRPKSSKTRLLRRSYTSGQETPSLYSEPVRHDDFENWDTSAIEEEYIPSPSQSRSVIRLEPIPGSRPVSPAKPLDGPFPETSPEETPLPESPIQSVVSSPWTQRGPSIDELPPLRRPSTHGSQVHPLFRAESPMPPPLHSPGTVITASPYAGQIIGRDHAMSPRHFYADASRNGSARSLPTAAASPTPETHQLSPLSSRERG